MKHETITHTLDLALDINEAAMKGKIKNIDKLEVRHYLTNGLRCSTQYLGQQYEIDIIAVD